MNRIVWSPLAVDDLESLRDYIARDSPAAAHRVALKIVNTVETLLPENPGIGRLGRVSGTRELVIGGTPFIVPYRAVGGDIHVLRVYHAARKWPDRF